MLDLQHEVIDAYPNLATIPAIENDQLRQMTQRTWLGRMVNEYGSSSVFASFADQCTTHAAIVGISPVEIERLQQFANEEKRHGILCGAVVETFGGSAIADHITSYSFPMHEDASPLEGILRNLLSICCLSETVAVALIAAEREDMPDGVLKDLLTDIWSDECGHAHFGWRHLNDWLPNDPILKNKLGEYLTVAFGHLEAHELAHLPLNSNPPKEGLQYGLCSGQAARALFYATVEGIIIPQLEHHGIPAKWAWENRLDP